MAARGCKGELSCLFMQGLALGTTLHYEFYQEAAGSGAGLRVIHLPRVDAYPETEHEIVHQLVQRYAVPEKLRCGLHYSMHEPGTEHEVV